MSYARVKKIWDQLGFQPRLTICLIGLFAIILAVGYWSLFLEFQTELQKDFDHSLYNYASDLLKNVHLNPGGTADLPDEVIFSEEKIFPFPHGDTLVKIYHTPFEALFSFTTDSDAPKDLSAIAELIQKNKAPQFLNLKSPAGFAWRGLLLPFNKSQDIYFFVAVPRTNLSEQEYKFRSIFIAGQIIILMISAFMISVLAKSLLVSLDNLTNSIHTMPINKTNFSFNVPEGPPEITLLAKVLNRLLAQIQQSLTAHQEFVAKAAHQLKTPLTIAKGHLEQAERNFSGIAQKELRVVMDELDLMSGTITNLLTLVQIESGFQSLHSIEINFLDQILSEIDRLDYLARKKGLKFQVFCQEQDVAQSDWLARTDPQLLSIIFTNLLENAIKYASESPIEVRIETQNDLILLQIRNRMLARETPVSPSLLKEKYVRGGSPETGQGLGLYIAYQVATALKINLNHEVTNQSFIVKLEIPKKIEPINLH